MAEYELLLSDPYQKCAETWPNDRDFWLGIAIRGFIMRRTSK